MRPCHGSLARVPSSAPEIKVAWTSTPGVQPLTGVARWSPWNYPSDFAFFDEGKSVDEVYEKAVGVLRSGRFNAIVVVAPTLNGQAPALPKGAWFSLVLAGLAGCLDIPGQTEASS